MSFSVGAFETASGLAKEVAKATESRILEQLNEFVSRGLIVIEQGPVTFVRTVHDDKIELRQTINLKLKDQEYIEMLEAKVKHLSEENLQLITRFAGKK